MIRAVIFASAFTLAFHLLRIAVRHKDWILANEKPKPSPTSSSFIPSNLVEVVTPQVLKDLDKILWPLYSVYIRSKDADWRGYVACFTCGLVLEWKYMDAGHCIPKGATGSALKYDERNTKPQCKTCNQGKGGNRKEFEARLKKLYGEGIIQELKRLTEAQLSYQDYKDLIAKYTTLVKIINTRK